jgi:hypothetical protein
VPTLTPQVRFELIDSPVDSRSLIFVCEVHLWRVTMRWQNQFERRGDNVGAIKSLASDPFSGRKATSHKRMMGLPLGRVILRRPRAVGYWPPLLGATLLHMTDGLVAFILRLRMMRNLLILQRPATRLTVRGFFMVMP